MSAALGRRKKEKGLLELEGCIVFPFSSCPFSASGAFAHRSHSRKKGDLNSKCSLGGKTVSLPHSTFLSPPQPHLPPPLLLVVVVVVTLTVTRP